MEYVVLARKLRPMRFAELIGQETVAKALLNAVRTGRVAHAYLFAGSRGVGKTSTARILAKALNCANPGEGEPCGECDNCREITANSSPDVFEIDAASNRGIDNIRELRGNTNYRPAKCRYKIYIIDEVHMMTTESFNALLKTLEEPPPAIKFILATTAPHKIPDTILSRCQRYDFARVPVATLTDYLETVCRGEGISLSREVLESISRSASGGVRDALTAVDQVVAFAGASPEEQQVRDVLGLTEEGMLIELLNSILDKALEPALDTFWKLVERGYDLTMLLNGLLREIKELTLYRTLGGESLYFQDHPPPRLEFYAAHKERHSLDELQQLFYLFLELERQLKLSEFSQGCFEMALTKAVRVAPLVGVPELLEQVRRSMREPPPPPAGPGPGSSPPEHRPRQMAAPRGREGRGGQAGSAASGPAESGSGDGEGERAAATAGPAPKLPAGGEPPGPPPQSPPPSPALAPMPESAPPPGIGGEPSAPAGHEGAALQPPGEAPPGEAPPPLEQELPCEEQRWRDFIDLVKTERPKLAAELRRADVGRIEAGEVLINPAGDETITEKELEPLQLHLRKSFGDSFHLSLNRDKNKRARYYHSLVGREQQREEAQREMEKREAIASPAVQRLLNFFPEGKIERVMARPGQSDRRKDV